MTANELLAIARAERPEVQYTRNVRGTAIAGRVSADMPWTMCAGLLLLSGHPPVDQGNDPDGKWASIGNLLVSGQPVVTDWVE